MVSEDIIEQFETENKVANPESNSTELMVNKETSVSATEENAMTVSNTEETSVQEIVDKQLHADLHEISGREEFKKASNQITERGVSAKLRERALEVLSAEQKNKLAEYTLKKEMERIDYVAKHEKSIEREAIKAQLYQRKYKNAVDRYGYLYSKEIVKTLNDKGEEISVVKYKNFTINRVLNRAREFASWYNNLEQTTRKMIFTTVKIGFILGLVAAGITCLVKLIQWLISSGLLNVSVG